MSEVFDEIELTDNIQEEEKDLLSYAKSIIACQMEIKSIQDDVKQIKADAREKGVPTKEIDAAISLLKKEAKLNPAEQEAQLEIYEKLKSNSDINDSIHMIV